MQVHYAHRACEVLYDFLVSNHISGTFLLPANICPSVPDMFREAGIAVRYVDIDPDTLCMDEQQALAQIKDCQGLLFVHTYGLECGFDEFFKSIRKTNSSAIIIDDRCLCMPNIENLTEYESTEADLILFSFGDKKQVQLGEGGIGIYADKWTMGNDTWRLDMERYLNQKQIAVQHVRKMQAIYADNLPKDIQLPIEYNNWRFNIRVTAEQKEQILKALFRDGLFASSHYRSLAENAEEDTPNAYQLQQEIINLFVDPKFYTEAQAKQTCKIVNDIFQQ